MNIIKQIKIFGDSILKGVQLNPNNNQYVVDNHIDIDLISKKHLVTIENYSKFGSTVTKGQKLMYKHLEYCDTVVMDFGGNDCDFNWAEISEKPFDEHQPHTQIDKFIQTYKEIIQKLKDKNILPILTTLPPIDPQKFFNWFCKGLNKENVLKWLGSINTIYRYQENYSRAVEQIAKEENVPIVDLRGAFLQNRRIEHLLCEDGIHPNTEGQDVITAAFIDFADKVAQARRNEKFLPFT